MQERQEPSFETPAAQSLETTAPTPRKRRRWMRALTWALLAILAILLGLIGAAWWWAGKDDSLARTLNRMANWMPADQKLEAKGVEGSLRTGGRIDWLRWSSPALQIEIKDADIAWRLQPLLSRQLHFGHVKMEELRIRSTPQPKSDSPTEPLQSLTLPMELDVPLRIEHVLWEGPPPLTITELHGHYRYRNGEHALDLTSLRYAEGFYTGQATLQGAAPMAVRVQVQGDVSAPLPQQPDQSLHFNAKARIEGTLATEAARLHITAQAASVPAKDDDTAPALSADVDATVRPWLPQPVEQAKADLRHVDLALFMPGGPRTDLNGSILAGPQGDGWQLQADVSNALPGPWDQQALPVHSLQAHAQMDGQQAWTLHPSTIKLGVDGQGQLNAQGSWNPNTQSLQASATVTSINPQTLYSTLAAEPLSGTLQADTDSTQTVQFQLDLQAANRRSNRTSQPLRIETARAQGSWKAPELQLHGVHVEALQAVVRSESLQINTETQHLQGQLQAQLPGTQAQLRMDAGPQSGEGQLELRIASAEQLAQWLTRLPLGNDPLQGAQLQGNANLDLSWRGGWALLQQRLQDPSAPRTASGLQLQGQLRAPALSYQAPATEALRVQDLNAQWNGTPEALNLQLQGTAWNGVQRMALDTALTAGLRTGNQVAATDWQARIQSLAARWSPDGSERNTWQATLTEPLSAEQLTSGNPLRSTRIQASAGQLRVSAPTHVGQNNAQITWQPITARQSTTGRWAVQSQGRLQGIPLAWVDAFSPDPSQPLLASAGLGGDLVVQGNWDVDTSGNQLRADVLLERASGDVRLSVEDQDAASVTVVRSSGATEAGEGSNRQLQTPVQPRARGISARLQALRLQVSAQGNDLRAQLLWNSERAGQIQADVRSQLGNSAEGLHWPAQAPISGTLKASLPNIGIWALFAPPGWRVGGTLSADVAIGGTRSAPNWNGQLQADQLSILSLLDGVDLRDGRLRAQLQGTRIDITELFLRGGEGSSTRILGQSGNLTAAPKDGGTLTGRGVVEFDPQAANGSSGIRMDLQAVADRLQVLIRADRQVSVSGTLQAGMNNGQVRLGGDLKVDRATIILADESAPKLDDDVFIHTAASRQAEQQRAQQAQTTAQGSVQAARPPDIDVRLNLGNDFALQGYGITTRLEGQLQLSNGPRLTGEVHTVNGRYRAWGQSLDVEEGTIRFNGPVDNPSLSITAIRPNIAVRAGAKVSGTASRPVVALFSEPEMSDAEKLSWIVMGRSASGGGAEAALLQQAALAMLSGGGGTGNFAGNLGLDEIGLRGPSDDGEADAAVTIGKRLSKDLYVAYEQSLSGAMGTLFIFYELSSRLTLRGQTGLQSAVDLIYTRQKD